MLRNQHSGSYSGLVPAAAEACENLEFRLSHLALQARIIQDLNSTPVARTEMFCPLPSKDEPTG